MNHFRKKNFREFEQAFLRNAGLVPTKKDMYKLDICTVKNSCSGIFSLLFLTISFQSNIKINKQVISKLRDCYLITYGGPLTRGEML